MKAFWGFVRNLLLWGVFPGLATYLIFPDLRILATIVGFLALVMRCERISTERFKSTFVSQEGVDEILGQYAAIFHKACMDEIAIQTGKGFTDDQDFRETAKLITGNVARLKRDFWRAQSLAASHGYSVHNSHKDYLPKPSAKEAEEDGAAHNMY